MNLPSISLVTPSYNQGKFVARTVSSILRQEYPRFDYTICDGMSSDETADILAGLDDPRLTVIREPDQGQADAIKKGFDRSGGEIVGWLNSDDILLPGALARVAEYFANHPEVDAIYSHRVFIDERDNVEKFWILPPHSDYCMRRWDYIPQETCFWRRRAMDEAGGVDPGFQFAMDYDLFERMMRQGKFVRLNTFLGAFRVHPEAKTSAVMADIGEPEIAKVRQRVGMTGSFFEKLLCHGYFQLLLEASETYRLAIYPGQKEVIESGIAASTAPM